MKKMKKILLVMTCMLLTAGMTACGSGNGADGTGNRTGAGPGNENMDENGVGGNDATDGNMGDRTDGDMGSRPDGEAGDHGVVDDAVDDVTDGVDRMTDSLTDGVDDAADSLTEDQGADRDTQGE